MAYRCRGSRSVLRLQLRKAGSANSATLEEDDIVGVITEDVNVVYAGYSEASTGNGDDMWPHSWTLDEFSLTIDGIIIDAYGCSAEFVGAEGEKMDGIGTFTHEFGHVLGLKDMYDTDEYTDGYGLDPGDYSIFASGRYNNKSRTPP